MNDPFAPNNDETRSAVVADTVSLGSANSDHLVIALTREGKPDVAVFLDKNASLEVLGRLQRQMSDLGWFQ